MQENLTPREQEIMKLLLDGISSKEITANMGISLKTVEFHKKNLYRKLNVQSIQELFAKNYNKEHKLKLSAEKPLIIIMGNDGEYGWQCKYYADPPFYNDKITAGDNYVFNCTYSSNVEIDMLQVAFVDNMIEKGNVGEWWTELCGFLVLRRDIKPNVKYKDSLSIIAALSASSTHINSNVFVLNAYRGTIKQPTLIFTQFEINKI